MDEVLVAVCLFMVFIFMLLTTAIGFEVWKVNKHIELCENQPTACRLQIMEN